MGRKILLALLALVIIGVIFLYAKTRTSPLKRLQKNANISRAIKTILTYQLKQRKTCLTYQLKQRKT